MNNWNDLKTCFVEESYDAKLKEIHHFKLHPELIPYVGPQYKDFKILFIGESHYIESGYSEDNFKEWYTVETPIELEKTKNWFNTRIVLGNFIKHQLNLSDKDSRYLSSASRSRAHSMFSNPANVFAEIVSNNNEFLLTDSDAFRCFSFFNYFQRPEIIKGNTIKDNDEDRKQAYFITEEIINILDPELIIFLSKKAYNAYHESKKVQPEIKNAQKEYKYDFVNHPTCRYWNKENGKQKLARLLEEYIGGKNEYVEKLQKIATLKRDFMMEIFREIKTEFEKQEINLFENYESEVNEYYTKKESTHPRIEFINSNRTRFGIEIEWNIYIGPYIGDGEKMYDKKWEYLSVKEGNKEDIREYVPDFKYCNASYVSLLDDVEREKFIRYCIKKITAIIICKTAEEG